MEIPSIPDNDGEFCCELDVEIEFSLEQSCFNHYMKIQRNECISLAYLNFNNATYFLGYFILNIILTDLNLMT